MTAAAISHGCRWFATGSCDETVRLWESPSGKSIRRPFTGHAGDVKCVRISRDDRLVASGAGDETVRIWDVRKEKLIVEPLQHCDSVKCVYFSRDNQQVI